MKILKFTLIFLLVLSFSVQAAKVHRVQRGENLYSIAEEYGVTISEIIHLNNLLHPGEIYYQQVLIIPDKTYPGIYRVQKGDTLYKISEKLGIPLKVLAAYNRLTYKDQLYARQILAIPYRFVYPQTYEVKKGDTLYLISQKYGVPFQEIIKFNKLSNTFIYVGQKLKIPVLKPNPPRKHPNYKLMYPDTLYYKGQSNGYHVALTFDDGPDSYYTTRVLEILKDYQVPATFFLIGKNIIKHTDVVRKIVQDGHLIANHSWSHPSLQNVSKKEMKAEINKVQEIIKKHTGINMRYLRPPWGFVSVELLEMAKKMDYKVINWSADSRDWQTQDVDQILINTIPRANKNAIILFHSAGGRNQNLDATINALPELIQTLRMNGYTFVSLDKLLNIPAYL